MEEGVYLLKLGIENIRCFGKKAFIDLTTSESKWNQWNIILGNNASGKTTLLQAISVLESVEDLDMDNKVMFVPYLSQDQEIEQSFLNKSKLDYFINALTTLSNQGKKCDVYYSYSPKVKGLSGFYEFKYSTLKIYGYGANRFMSRSSFSESKSENSATLFDNDAKLINAEEWLLQLDYSASKPSSIQEFAAKRRDQVKEILREVLPDIEAIRFTEPTKENLKTAVEFQTPYGWVTIHQLSLGYKTMVAWMVDLAARLFERYPDSDNPLAEPAIVLVDEIDLHMHPKWQRKIFDYLSEKFPKTQFIVTAHSPLIVQSAPKDANIVLLRREGDHVVIDNNIQSVHNWRIDQILGSELFDFIPTRSSDNEVWMKERETLILKGDKLTEAEQRQLAELNQKAYDLPTAEDPLDIEAMNLLRQAAKHFKPQTT